MKHGRNVGIVMLCLAGMASGWAQYKVVEPDGRVTYTDRPGPSRSARVEPMRSGAAAVAPAAGASELPFELRQIAQRYPVTLYTRGDCASCDSGRNYLRQRGIPYVERTVVTTADVQAFQRIESSNELPVLRIGSQQLRGYSDLEWSGFLDAAGYPKESRLPSSYRGWTPQPLVDATPGPVAGTPPAAAPQEATPPEPATLPPSLQGTPDGIRF